MLKREHLLHAGTKKTILDIAAKYYWLGFKKDVKQMVGDCASCQTYGRSQKSEPQRLSLEYVNRPMQSIGLNFFHRNDTCYIIQMNHFSGQPMIKKMIRTTSQDMIR